MDDRLTTNGRPKWPEVLAEIRSAETRIRQDVVDVKSDVADLKKDVSNLSNTVTLIETARAVDEERTRTLFRVGDLGRQTLLVFVAVIGVALGVFNILR